MIQSIYSAASAVSSQQSRMDVTANNLANVNTVGFKGSRLDFKDALYSELLRPVQPQDGLNLQSGHGVHVAETMLLFNQGAITLTNVPLDLCIDGRAFFTARNPQGELVYTRSGAFKASVEDDGRFLVTENGYYVMDSDGERIELPEQLSQFIVNKDGSISLGAEQNTQGISLGLVDFPNRDALNQVGGSYFQPSDASGEPFEAETDQFSVVQGAQESSNVNLAQEMTRVIRSQRAFQLASRAISTADEMEGVANNIRT